MSGKRLHLFKPIIQAKKTGAHIKIKPFPLQKISDLLRKLSGFKYETEIDLRIGYYHTIDLRMGYYHISLDWEAQKLCTTILPSGKYQYKRLPMGVKTSPALCTLLQLSKS
jgi:hypothetical protein